MRKSFTVALLIFAFLGLFAGKAQAYHGYPYRTNFDRYYGRYDAYVTGYMPPDYPYQYQYPNRTSGRYSRYADPYRDYSYYADYDAYYDMPSYDNYRYGYYEYYWDDPYYGAYVGGYRN